MIHSQLPRVNVELEYDEYLPDLQERYALHSYGIADALKDPLYGDLERSIQRGRRSLISEHPEAPLVVMRKIDQEVSDAALHHVSVSWEYVFFARARRIMHRIHWQTILHCHPDCTVCLMRTGAARGYLIVQRGHDDDDPPLFFDLVSRRVSFCQGPYVPDGPEIAIR